MATTTLTEVELQAFPNTSSPCESDPEDIRQDTTPPTNAVEVLQKWNYPPKNVYRVGASFWSFFLMGMNDGSYGALIPYLEQYYNLSYTVISLIFLSPFAGYTFASLINDSVHVKFGQRVLVVMFVFVGIGNGLADAAWCAWIGNMVSANQVQGFLQACYSLGGTIAPLIAAGMLAKTGPSHQEQLIDKKQTAVAATELITSAWAFWAQTGQVYSMENPRDVNAKTGRLREALSNKLTWIFAAFIFGYVGAEVSLGGWIVTFMTQVRSGTTFSSSLTSTGFWAGMTVGRIGLAFLTAWLGEFTSVLVYLGICIALELLFWLIPSFYVSAISIAFLGLFLGPYFQQLLYWLRNLCRRNYMLEVLGLRLRLEEVEEQYFLLLWERLPRRRE
ncbi:hypothetical protein H4I96_08466 [Botrytis cinerea]